MSIPNIIDLFIDTLYNKVSTWIHKTLLVFTILCFLTYDEISYFYPILILYLMTFFNIHYRHYIRNSRNNNKKNFAHTNTVVLSVYLIAYLTIGIVYLIVTDNSTDIDSAFIIILCSIVNAILYVQPILSGIFKLLTKCFGTIINSYNNAVNNYRINALYRQGDNLYKQEKYFEAIEVYEEAASKSKKAKFMILYIILVLLS